ncbi:unnamed protein product, partial [Ectocarpus sp. 12 AP-2014]
GHGNDVLRGDSGFDVLRGNGGADVFLFLKLTDSPTGSRFDRIVDFTPGQDDVHIRAIAGGATLALGGGFSGDGASVSTREANGNTIVSLDADGDGRIDMRLLLLDAMGLTADDFVL